MPASIAVDFRGDGSGRCRPDGVWARRSLARRREADDGRERNPVRVLALDVAAVNHVDIPSIDRSPAQAGLEPRLRDTGDLCARAGLAEDLRGECPDIVRGSPVDADPVGEVIAIHRAIP